MADPISETKADYMPGKGLQLPHPRAWKMSQFFEVFWKLMNLRKNSFQRAGATTEEADKYSVQTISGNIKTTLMYKEWSLLDLFISV